MCLKFTTVVSSRPRPVCARPIVDVAALNFEISAQVVLKKMQGPAAWWWLCKR